jgi:hypothetical protein
MKSPGTITKYQFTKDMAELSGFGGGYEQACRNMVVAGCEWFDKHKRANPKFEGLKNIYGLTFSKSKSAKSLEKAIIKVNKGATGAQFEKSLQHVFYIQDAGWEKYVKESKKQKKKDRK